MQCCQIMIQTNVIKFGQNFIAPFPKFYVLPQWFSTIVSLHTPWKILFVSCTPLHCQLIYNFQNTRHKLVFKQTLYSKNVIYWLFNQFFNPSVLGGKEATAVIKLFSRDNLFLCLVLIVAIAENVTSHK